MSSKPTPEQLEEYRRMTPGERLAETATRGDIETDERVRRAADEEAQKAIDRFFRMVNCENDMRNKNMLEAFARLKRREEDRKKNEDASGN